MEVRFSFWSTRFPLRRPTPRQPPPWLHELSDPLDDQGNVHVSQKPGLGQAINFDYIHEHAIKTE